MQNSVSGFSKFTKAEKIDWLISNHFQNNAQAKANLERYWNTDEVLQKLHDEFTENTISNFSGKTATSVNYRKKLNAVTKSKNFIHNVDLFIAIWVKWIVIVEKEIA